MEKRNRQPFAVTITIGGVFLLGAGYFLQSGQALSRYALHDSLPFSVPAWYQPLTAALWGGLWLGLGVGLWRRKAWARRLTLIAIPLQLGAWLADWRLFSRSTIAIQSFEFDLVLRLLASGLAMAVFLLGGRRDTAGRPPAAAPQDPERESKQPHVD